MCGTWTKCAEQTCQPAHVERNNSRADCQTWRKHYARKQTLNLEWVKSQTKDAVKVLMKLLQKYNQMNLWMKLEGLSVWLRVGENYQTQKGEKPKTPVFLLGIQHLWLMPRNKVLRLMDPVWCSECIWEAFEVELDNLCNLKGISWRLIF